MSANFVPTSAERSLVTQIFSRANSPQSGLLPGDLAVKIFAAAKLPPTVLGEIWNLADENDQGSLTEKGVSMALRLIGYAQRGDKVTSALLNKPGPPPVLDGYSTVSQQNTGMSMPRSPPPSFPPLSVQDRVKFNNLFAKAGPTNGLLSGDKARDLFIKSKLPTEKLSQIWNLADTQDRGSLDAVDFAIGMYFIQGLMSGQLAFIPTSLPPGLYQQAGGSAAGQGIAVQMTGTSGTFSPSVSTFPQRAPLQTQLTGQSQSLQPDYTGMSSQRRAPALPSRPSIPSVLGSTAFGDLTSNFTGGNVQWDVDLSERNTAYKAFDDLDLEKKGYLEGDRAVPFMLESKLSEETLAQIWDLADINNDGRLTRDGFAVAVHLIRKKLRGEELPTMLPSNLVPPSMRNNTAVMPISHSQPVHEPPNLFSFDDTPPQSAVSPQATGNMPFLQPQQTGQTNSKLASKPHIPSQSMDPFSDSPFDTTPAVHHDLLGDDDTSTTASPPLQDRSAEIGNLKNQLSSTNRSMESAKADRVKLEQALADQASQLSALQMQLSSAKAAYEAETKLVTALTERHSSQLADIQKAREELIRAESDLSALRVEKAEIEGSFLRDKEETRDFHKRMIEVGQQAEALKRDVEKVKKDAKQQRGLLAIAKKQLATKETDKAKVQKEMEDAAAELAAITKEKDEAEIELAKEDVMSSANGHPERALSSDSLMLAANQPLPPTPDPSVIRTASPAGGKSNNPFERLTMGSVTSTPRSTSPLSPFHGGSSAPGEAHEIMGSNQQDSINIVTQAPEKDQQSNPAAESAINDTPLDLVMSPTDTEYFITPPQTADAHSNIVSPVQESTVEKDIGQYTSIDEAVSHFPPVDDIGSKETSVPKAEDHQTDLKLQLKELDINESDSDSDSDEIPLATLAASVGKDKESKPAAITGSDALFDDVFGVDAANSIAWLDNQTDNATSTKPSDLLATKAPETAVDATASGVDAFDEAMGKIPTAPSMPGQFAFDSAFDDNFDFGGSKETAQPLVPPATQSPLPQQSTFDDVFTSPSVTSATVTQSATSEMTEPSTPSPSKSGPSFEEVFSSFHDTPSLALGAQIQQSSTLNSPSIAQPSNEKPFPTTSPTPPRQSASPPRNSNFSLPTRTTSPSPRTSSPKPRVSSSSSKEVHEKVKEPPTRHSKLSIRLPFGKKKKSQIQEPLPLPRSQHLSPPEEEPHRTLTPSSDDDVEAVKQLTAMGFSRSQAVEALEKYGYDVPRALNSLLGA
ncbi:hypothetical protein BDQ17DRAFT_1357829 [Cyathus striatus]|nr:hypothetical protein BDQ17DRAFT_1357829 [Cyathus striatus]